MDGTENNAILGDSELGGVWISQEGILLYNKVGIVFSSTTLRTDFIRNSESAMSSRHRTEIIIMLIFSRMPAVRHMSCVNCHSAASFRDISIPWNERFSFPLFYCIEWKHVDWRCQRPRRYFQITVTLSPYSVVKPCSSILCRVL